MTTLRILTKHLFQMQKFAFVGLFILLNLSLKSQTSNSDFERIKIIDGDTEFSGTITRLQSLRKDWRRSE